VKERLLITGSDESYSGSLQSAILEAGRHMVNLFSGVSATSLSTGSYPILSDICADFAAAIFERRWLNDNVQLQGQLPVQQTEQYSGYWAEALVKWKSFMHNFYLPIITISQSGSYYDFNSGSSGSYT